MSLSLQLFIRFYEVDSATNYILSRWRGLRYATGFFLAWQMGINSLRKRVGAAWDPRTERPAVGLPSCALSRGLRLCIMLSEQLIKKCDL